MTTIEKMVRIAAPPERVFSILDDPGLIILYAPGAKEVTEEHRSSERVGDSYQVTYSVMGVRFPMTLTVDEYEKDSKLVLRMTGAMTGSFVWSLSSSGDSTETKVRINYEMKGGAVAKVADALFLEGMNKKNAERMLENIKALAESSFGH